MKKLKLLLLISSFLFLGCDMFITKIAPMGNDSNVSTISIDENNLLYKLEQKESFILYISNPTCTSCATFKGLLNSYIEKSTINIYEIDYLDCPNKIHYTTMPTLTFIKDGRQYKTLNYSLKDETFRSLEGLEKTINENIYGINMIEKSEDSIDKMIENKETFLLYIGWSKCGDCALLKSEVLDSYLNKKMKAPIIYLESHKYRSLKPNSNPYDDINSTADDKLNWDNWINFATKYNFVSYENGKVPALIYYENGIFTDYLIYHNDIRDNDVFVTSFFPELIGQTQSEEQYIKYHNKKALEFLNKYL